MRQMPRVAIIDALGSARPRNGIPFAVEHAEGVTVFEYERLQFRERHRGRNCERVAVAGVLRGLLPGGRSGLSCFLLSRHRSIRIRRGTRLRLLPALFRDRPTSLVCRSGVGHPGLSPLLTSRIAATRKVEPKARSN